MSTSLLDLSTLMARLVSKDKISSAPIIKRLFRKQTHCAPALIATVVSSSGCGGGGGGSSGSTGVGGSGGTDTGGTDGGGTDTGGTDTGGTDGGGTDTGGTDSGGRTFNYQVAPTSVGVSMMGNLFMANGAAISTWYFGNGFNDDRDLAGPVFEANEGETVQITLSSMMPHSIHFHGLDVDQANDGVPSTSGYVGGGMGGGGMGGGGMGGGGFGRVSGYTSLGSSYTYTFTAPHAGTYAYHCHVDTSLHFEMGMYGTVIIRPANGSTNVAWTGGPTFDKEYIWQLGTFDRSWHGSMVSGSQTARYRPNYFLINGRDGTNASTDPTVAVTAMAGQKVLIRVNGTSYMPSIVRLGGLSFEVIASDGRPLASPVPATEQLVCAGERYDLLLTMPLSGQFTATVDYYNIRSTGILGTATTKLTVV